MNILFLYVTLMCYPLFSMENTNEIVKDTEISILHYCTQHNIHYNTYENNQTHPNIPQNSWQINSNTDLTYPAFLYTGIYQATHDIIHSASLQTLNPEGLEQANQNKELYINPLHHGVEKNAHSLSPRAFAYNTFQITKIYKTFVFNNIFDGPNQKNIWLFGYHNKAAKTPRNKESLIKISKIINPTIENPTLNSKPFKGEINALLLEQNLNKFYMAITCITKKDTLKTFLYKVIFSMNHQEISFTKYRLSTISTTKKLLKLSHNLLLLLTTEGTLYKINTDSNEAARIDVVDYNKNSIKLADIINNNALPYLWLLISDNRALYFLNLKNKSTKITFVKIADLTKNAEVWFDSNNILVKHFITNLIISKPIQNSIPIQYSLYKLYSVLSKATVSMLLKDNNSAK